MKSYDVIIIGGGINGMTAACALFESGFKVALIEKDNIKNKIHHTRDGRGIAMARRSRDILQEYNIWQYISHEVGEMHKIVVMDGDSNCTLEFDNALVNGEPIGFLIESDNILKGLYKKLCNSRVDLLEERECCKLEFTANGAAVTLSDDSVLESKVVIVTNGKNSDIRESVGLHCNKKDYHQMALVFNIKHSRPHNNYAYECFLKNGPFALLPLCDAHESSVVWCDNIALAKIDINKKELESCLKLRCAGIYDEVEIITEVAKFPLSLSYMDEYYKNRAVFIGDSLHFIHPVAGQGYNLSIRDIEALVGLFTKYRNLGFDIGSEGVLKAFTSYRKKDNLTMIKATDALNALFTNDSSMIQLCRRFGLEAVNNMPFLKKFFMKKAMGY